MTFVLCIVGFFHGSSLCSGLLNFAPDAGEGGLDLLLEAGNQFTVGGDEGLLGFDLGHASSLLPRRVLAIEKPLFESKV